MIAAIDVYVNNFRIISHLIQHVVAPVYRRNQRLVQQIFTGKSEWGEACNLLHPSSLSIDILNLLDRYYIADRSKITLCRELVSILHLMIILVITTP